MDRSGVTIGVTLPSPELVVLDNGLRLVHIHHPAAGAGIFGIAVRAGSANESPSEYGLAHFVEHTIFKGTRRRSSWNIINRMEAVGGELNAFTTKEETVVYSVFPPGNAVRAIELIADLAINSRFPADELDKEREVVIDEINSYRDTPAEAIYDEFEEYALAPTALAHNILGTPESVRNLGSEECLRFISDNYTTANIVAFYSGPETPERIARSVSRYFAPMAAGERTVQSAGCTSCAGVGSFEHTIQLDIHQSHVVLGTTVPGLYSPERQAVALLANIVGGPGMNSLLNVSLRERRGLVYSVEASTAMFSTCGLLTVYFGCDSDDVPRCRRLCRNVFRQIADGGFSGSKLERAKRQYIGQLSIATENRENRIMAAARSVLFRGHTVSFEETSAAIAAVTSGQLAALAASMSEASALIYTNK